jgi:hypothetical protein
MADTLAEIYRDTLTESDFNSSGEATIVTTDSSTSHVIKSIQAEEVDDELLLQGSLDVNGFTIVGLTANSSGTEIVAPSSTVKVKTNSIPFTYLDNRFYVQTSGTNLKSYVDAKINDVLVSAGLIDTTNSLPTSMTATATHKQIVPFLGPNNNTVMTLHDLNSVTSVYLYNSAGTEIHSNATNYNTKWFDGKRYVYYIGTSNNNIYKIDTWASSNFESLIYTGNFPSGLTTYQRMFGIEGEWLFFWPDQSGAKGFAYNLQTDTLQDLTGNNVDNAFSNMHQQYYAVKTTDGIKIVVTDDNEWRCWTWDGSLIFDGNTQSAGRVSTTLSGNTERPSNSNSAHKVALGSRLYYINNNNNLAYFEFEGTPAFGAQLTTSNSFAIANASYKHLSYSEITPTASEISDRNISTNIGVKLRITGVTST